MNRNEVRTLVPHRQFIFWQQINPMKLTSCFAAFKCSKLFFFINHSSELTPFAVGGPHCRLQYLDGKCERNDKEEWITQLGFNWEFLLEDESYYTGMSTFSSRAPSSFQMDLLGDNTTKKGLYQCISTTSVGNLSHSEESSLNQRFKKLSKSSHFIHSSDPKMLAEMLLKQIRCEGQQIREDIERHKQNYLSISNNPQSSPLKVDSSKPPICKLCLQVDGAKVALICQGCHFFIIKI